MYFIGIDISKFKHDCAVIDSQGEVVTPSWSFLNTHEGFASLNQLLTSLKGEKRIGFESTGHYGQNLKLFLETNSFAFMEFNPLMVKRFVDSKTLRRTKSDSIDAMSIAQYLMTVDFKPYPKSFYHIEALKSLTRFRDSLIRQRSRQLVELTNILDKVFPEFKPFFKGRFSATALYILENYSSPEKIANMNVKSYELLRSRSKGKFTTADFAQLKLLAKNTVGNPSAFLLSEMNIILDIYSQMDAKVQELEEQIISLVNDMNPPMLSIPGIGHISAAVILSEFGDFNNFKNASKLLSFAGLEPGYYQSGTAEHSGCMVKHGSSYLRYTLMNCCIPLIRSDIVFAEYYAKKRAEGKPYRVALTHVVKKLLRVIYAIQTKNVLYDPTLIR